MKQKLLLQLPEKHNHSTPSRHTDTHPNDISTLYLSPNQPQKPAAMNDLKGKLVNIVLTVEEGRGFESIKSPVYITANFNGRVMESDVMEAHQNVLFNVEMVWETEKKLLRKARGAYARVRIECFTVEKRCVGFALMCLRSAKIVAGVLEQSKLVYTWTKLLNVPTEYKKGGPELNVSLTIRDSSSNRIPPALPCFELPRLVTSCLQIPIKYTTDGFIQVGNDHEELEKYVFKITVCTASNLDVLLPESQVFNHTAKKYFLSFHIFGINVKTRTLNRDLHETIRIDESIVINLLSSYDNLGMYFQQFPKIPIKFYNDDVELGTSEINIAWEEKRLDGRMEFQEESLFEGNDVGLLRRPVVVTRTVVMPRSDKEIGQGDDAVSPKVKYSSHTEGELLVEAKGADKRLLFKQTLGKIERNATASLVRLASENVEVIGSGDVHKQFCLDVILDSICWKRLPRSASYAINFLHPRAGTYLSVKVESEKQVGKKLLLENVLCKMIFVCTKGRLQTLLRCFPPRVQLLDSKNQPLVQDFTLDYTRLSLGKPEWSYSVVLKSPTSDDIAELNVAMFLEACKVSSDGSSNYDLLPHILDDTIIFQGVEELDAWKEAEKLRYKEEMERLRKEELQVLHEDWMSRKNKLENDLRNNLARCKKLSRELKKRAQQHQVEDTLAERRDKDEHFNLHLEIHKNAVKYALCDPHELIETISRLERDCTILRDLLGEQNLELLDIKKSALTGDQAKNLLQDLKVLQEKYEVVLRDKNYFKAEYEKAAQEVHELKQMDNRQIQERIASDKEELSQLSLESFISMDDV